MMNEGPLASTLEVIKESQTGLWSGCPTSFTGKTIQQIFVKEFRQKSQYAKYPLRRTLLFYQMLLKALFVCFGRGGN